MALALRLLVAESSAIIIREPSRIATNEAKRRQIVFVPANSRHQYVSLSGSFGELRFQDTIVHRVLWFLDVCSIGCSEALFDMTMT